MPTDHTRRVVLVVEDDELLRSDIVSEFSWQGWRVLDTASGEHALALAQKNRVDAVLTDIQLDGLVSGWDVAEAVRGVWPQVAVIYTSGNAPDTSRLVQGGVFLDKPCDPAQVVDTSHRLCATGP